MRTLGLKLLATFVGLVSFNWDCVRAAWDSKYRDRLLEAEKRGDRRWPFNRMD